MKIKLLLITLCCYCTTAFSVPKEEIIILKTETGSIEGSLLIPDAEFSSTLALIISGSGPTDRDGNNAMMKNNSLKMLAEGLAEHGISSLRFDKRGVGKSAKAYLKEIDMRFETYVEDVKSWIDLLHQDKRFKTIIVIGHSEGSLIGMIASQKPEVHKFISLAGTGQPALELIKKQLKAQPQFVYDQSLPIIEKLSKGDTINTIPPFLMAVFRPSIQPYLLSWFKYDPQKEIKKLNKPVLLIQGTTDLQISIEDVEELAQAKPDAQKKIFEGMNHILKDAEADRVKNLTTYNKPDLPLKENLIKTIIAFIKQ